jgi:hypothetical protein
MKTRRLVLIWAVSLPLAAWADDRVFGTRQTYARIPIPDQQALICFSNGVEHLVFEASFIAEGTNFGWVVPVPSEPTVTVATRGLFPTLRNIFQPVVHTTVAPVFSLFSVAVCLLHFILCVRRTGSLVFADFVVVARWANRPIVRSMSRWSSPMGRSRGPWRRACICPRVGLGIGRAVSRPRAAQSAKAGNTNQLRFMVSRHEAGLAHRGHEPLRLSRLCGLAGCH